MVNGVLECWKNGMLGMLTLKLTSVNFDINFSEHCRLLQSHCRLLQQTAAREQKLKWL